MAISFIWHFIVKRLHIIKIKLESFSFILRDRIPHAAITKHLTWLMKQVSPRCSNTFVAFDTPGITQYARINICQCDHWPFWAQASMSIESHLWKWPEPLGPQPDRGRVPSPHLTWCPETSPPPPIPLIFQPNCPPLPSPPYSLLVHLLPGHRITIKSVNWLPLLSFLHNSETLFRMNIHSFSF